MKCHSILPVAVLLAATSTVCLSDTFLRTTRPTLDDSRPTDPTWLGAIEPGPALVEPGDPAPDFAYDADSGERFRLHELLAHGSVLLVFVPTEAEMRSMELERNSMFRVGVVPVAVLDRRPSAAVSIAQRLRLTYPVIADPQGAIASQFNLLGPPTVKPHPAWFVVDRAGQVRALDRRGLPEGGYTRIACDALAIPSPDATVSTGTR